MPERLDDPFFLRHVFNSLDDLVTRTEAALPDDERAHGWTDHEWALMADIVRRWRDRITDRGFLSSTDVGWQTRALFDFEHVDSGYGVAKSFVALGNDISDAFNRQSH